MNPRRTAGFLVFIGGMEVILGIMLAEFVYPGYSVSNNYISDLGVWDKPSAIIFNLALVIYGLIIIIAAYMLRDCGYSKNFYSMFVLFGVGAVGVGLFDETIRAAHAFFALIAFIFGALAAILSYKVTTRPFSFLCVPLGLTGLAALILFIFNVHLGLGTGGMERMIMYPVLLWSLGFGGYLLSQPEPLNPSNNISN